MILTIVGLIICVSMLGLITLYCQLIDGQISLRQLVKDEALKTRALLASLRHDLALDRQGMDERFNDVEAMISNTNAEAECATDKVTELYQLMTTESEKTRKEFLGSLTQAAIEHGETRDLVKDEHKLTRRRIAEVKTRLADEERQDQKEKAKARQAKKTTKK